MADNATIDLENATLRQIAQELANRAHNFERTHQPQCAAACQSASDTLWNITAKYPKNN